MAIYDSINKSWTVSAGNNGNFTLLLSTITDNIYASRYGVNNTPTEEDLNNLNTIINNIYEKACIYFNLNILILPSYYNLELQQILNLDTSSLHLSGQALNLDIAKLNRNIKNSDLFNYIKNNLQFNQLIWEFGDNNEPEYVYISYLTSDTNLNQILRLKAKGLNYEDYINTPTFFNGLYN